MTRCGSITERYRKLSVVCVAAVELGCTMNMRDAGYVDHEPVPPPTIGLRRAAELRHSENESVRTDDGRRSLPARSRPNTATRNPPHEAGANWAIPIAHNLGLMTVMRIGEAVIWPEPFADFSSDQVGRAYEQAFTEPPLWDGSQDFFEWDGDHFLINGVGHALFGSELFLRARTCRHGPWVAAGFAVVGSTLWEYGFEASGARPSGLDLWYTPLSGVVLGEARYWLWRASSAISDRTWRTVAQAAVDPLGEFERFLGSEC